MAVSIAAEACQGLFLWVEAPGCGLGQQRLRSLSFQKCSINSILFIIIKVHVWKFEIGSDLGLLVSVR